MANIETIVNYREKTGRHETKEFYVQKVACEAREQVKKYLQTENARRRTDLKTGLLILVGHDWHLVAEIV